MSVMLKALQKKLFCVAAHLRMLQHMALIATDMFLAATDCAYLVSTRSG